MEYGNIQQKKSAWKMHDIEKDYVVLALGQDVEVLTQCFQRKIELTERKKYFPCNS